MQNVILALTVLDLVAEFYKLFQLCSQAEPHGQRPRRNSGFRSISSLELITFSR